MVSLEVIPVGGAESQSLGFIIAFEATRTSSPQAASEDTYNAERLRITQLEAELGAAKEHLQSVINEREVANEELRSIFRGTVHRQRVKS